MDGVNPPIFIQLDERPARGENGVCIFETEFHLGLREQIERLPVALPQNLRDEESIGEQAFSSGCLFETVENLKTGHRIAIRIVRMQPEGNVRVCQIVRTGIDDDIKYLSIVCLAYPADERGSPKNLAFFTWH